MSNGWTGGQYSVLRAILGGYLAIHFIHLAPWAAELFSSAGALPDATASPLLHLFPNIFALWDGPVFVTAVVAVAACLALALALGVRDRVAAVALWYVWACLLGRNPLISNPGIPYIGWLLLAHAFLPGRPYGSWSARGRDDPGGGWRMPGAIHRVAWALMALGYTYSGATKLISPSWIDGTAARHVLENPLARPGALRDALLELPDPLLRLATWSALVLELACAPLALFRRVRPWLWLTLLSMHFGLMLLVDFVDLSLGMVMLHLFTFDPAWIRPLRAPAGERLFYDGSCGLCHRFVRFVLAEDSAEDTFRFAPLGGDTFQSSVAPERRAGLPDSIVLLRPDGEMLVRSRAVRRIGDRLGGLWRCLAVASRVVPTPWLDRLYDVVAAVRHRMFARPEQACPLLPRRLRERFEP